MKHLVIIASVLPEPNSTAAGKRMLQLLELFKDQNYRISFLYTAQKGTYSANLSPLGVEEIPITLNDSNFDDLLAKLNPSIVLFDRFTLEEQFGWRAAQACPSALKILDTEDLHFLRKARERAYTKGIPFKDSDLQSEVFHREIASILRCDLSLIISEFEYALLTKNYALNPEILIYLPLFAEAIVNSPPFESRQDFISIGNFLHAPNYDTVLELKKLWPEIKKRLARAKMLIYGAYPSAKLKPLHDPSQGFLVMGRAENLQEVLFNARVLLAPIPYGAGLKGKLLDSMSYGLPSVSSSSGAEGIQGTMPWNGFIADSPAELVDKAVLLYQEESIWNQSRAQGYHLIESRFQKKQFAQSFHVLVNSTLERLAWHRQKNYLGALLQHHTLQSTKYLSRWIEEKNKKS